MGDSAGRATHVDRVGERLGLDDADLGPTRAVLAAHGNCSSPTVLLVLERLVAEEAMSDGDRRLFGFRRRPQLVYRAAPMADGVTGT